MDENYLKGIKAQFAYYKLLGQRTFDQLSEKELFWKYNQESNSIAIIVQHISGNMESRWTDFLTSDGEKPWRNRDQEFEENMQTEEEVYRLWGEGWDCLFEALDAINSQNFNDLVYIRNKGHTIPEAINRQLAHYAYHIGQIVYVGRMIKGEDWKSLSIPHGQSEIYNNDQFSMKKRRAHYTDEFLSKGNQ